MAVTSGFFNSVNHDRLYNAEQISSMFDGIILDGIYQGLGDAFIVKPYSDLNCTVTVGTGRAWFDHTWTLNSTELALTLDDPNVLYDRIDAIVIDVDRRQDVRANSIKVVKGTVSEHGATKPNLIEEELHNQYPLAYVTVKAGSAAPIQAQYIENAIGKTKTPLVAGVLDHMDITMFVQQMEGEFNVWFEGLKDVVSGDSITKLQQQINDINEYIELQKPVSIDGLSYEKAQNSKLSVVNFGEANTQSIILPDGYVFRPYPKTFATYYNWEMYGQIYNLDSVAISDTDLGFQLLYQGADSQDAMNDVRPYHYCLLMQANADEYPVTIDYLGLVYVSTSERIYIRHSRVTITSDHIVSATKENSSVGIHIYGNQFFFPSDTCPKLQDGSYIYGFSTNTVDQNDPSVFSKISSDGVITKSVNVSVPYNGRGNNGIMGIYVSKEVSPTEIAYVGINNSYQYSYGWTYLNTSTLEKISPSPINIPTIDKIAVSNDSYIVKSDKKTIAKYQNSLVSTNVGSVRPSIAIASTLEGGSTFSGYKGAVSSKDQKVLFINYSNSLVCGLSLGGGLLSWTGTVSGNALSSQQEVMSMSIQPYNEWNSDNVYRWIIPGTILTNISEGSMALKPPHPYLYRKNTSTSYGQKNLGSVYMLTLKIGD